jgi:hypothetical protein
MVGGSRNGSGRGIIRALPPAPWKKKKKIKGTGVSVAWGASGVEKERDSDGLRLRRTCRPPDPVKAISDGAP